MIVERPQELNNSYGIKKKFKKKNSKLITFQGLLKQGLDLNVCNLYGYSKNTRARWVVFYNIIKPGH